MAEENIVPANTGNIESVDIDSQMRTAYLDYAMSVIAVSYTHLRAHETVLDLVCRLLLEKKNNYTKDAESQEHT